MMNKSIRISLVRNLMKNRKSSLLFDSVISDVWLKLITVEKLMESNFMNTWRKCLKIQRIEILCWAQSKDSKLNFCYSGQIFRGSEIGAITNKKSKKVNSKRWPELIKKLEWGRIEERRVEETVREIGITKMPIFPILQKLIKLWILPPKIESNICLFPSKQYNKKIKHLKPTRKSMKVLKKLKKNK